MSTHNSIDVRALANYLLAKADVDQQKLDQLRLQKLAYIAHGWHLALCGDPLVYQQVEAWPYGPVFPVLYHSFKQFGPNPIEARAVYYDREAGAWKDYQADMPESMKRIVDQVWEKYKWFTGNQLIAATHKTGTPWEVTVRGKKHEEVRGILIPNDVIRQHYIELAIENKKKLDGE